MVSSGHCNITMICACCDLNIPLPFVSLNNFSHVVLTTAASVLCRTQAATLAARASTQSPAQVFQNAELCTNPRSILSVKNIFLISYHGKWCIPWRFSSNVIERHRAMSHVLAVAESCVSELKAWRGFSVLCEGHSVCLCCVPPRSKWPLKG